MATVDLYGQAPSGYVWSKIGCSVRVKLNWADEWTWLPFVAVKDCEDVAAPSVGQATFIYQYGYTKRAELANWATYSPLYINGAYVQIVVWNRWGAVPLWHGVIQRETVRPMGDTDQVNGQQAFVAFDLKHVLDRQEMLGSYTEDGYIDRGLVFNTRRQRGYGYETNRSAAVDGDGVYVFGDSAAWTHADIANYVTVKFANAGITWYAIGQSEAMAYMVEEINLHGRTPKAALDMLVSRKRGLGWTVDTNGEGVVYIYVFSTVAVPVAGGGVYLPPNNDQRVLYFAGAAVSQPEISLSHLDVYDKIVVRGGPVYSVATYSYADGTLVEGWSGASETAYAAGTGTPADSEELHDAERETEKYDDVFQRHHVVASWDGRTGNGAGGGLNYATPLVDWDGTVVGGTGQTPHRAGLQFERTLPIELAGSSPGGTDYTRPLVVVQAATAEDGDIYILADRLEVLGKAPANLDVLDGDLGVMLRPRSANHKFGLNHYDPATAADSASDPQVDYTTMILTAMFATDQHLQVTLERYGWPLGETSRTKLISMPDATAIYVAPGTVKDVTNGALTYETSGLLRDDGDRVRQVAALAAAWFGTPRATVRINVSTMALSSVVGSMIAAIVGPEGVTWCNTVVTRRVWQFDAEGVRTTVQTDYEELDFVNL